MGGRRNSSVERRKGKKREERGGASGERRESRDGSGSYSAPDSRLWTPDSGLLRPGDRAAVLVAATAFAAVLHVLPVVFPFLAPLKLAVADRAGFRGEGPVR